jgi:hypothetical protein
MPIDHSGNGYLATDAGILVDAFEGALKALRLVDRNDPAALGPVLSCATFSRERTGIKRGTPLYNLVRPYGMGIRIGD